MQITKLRLLGFKSFVEPTELVIGKGMTGVVGPNGCGKSNLLEALRWVMGETSYKTMRASAMDDVIFSGTQSRPARNSAEVSLFLDNKARTAPAEFNETDVLEVTRRIEREAGSAYHINGRDTRARDVKLLFEDAATGARSNALVQQGQIGQVINAKPQARRRLLEDAAGIAGLHSRRHEAELRLKAAETNLLRVSDTLGQLKSQMNSLKRQARQARRYRELTQEIQHTEAIFFHLSWSALCDAVENEERQLGQRLAELASITQAQAAATTQHVERTNALPPLREAEAEKAAALQRLTIELESLDQEAERLRERSAQLKAQQSEISLDLEREEQRQIEAETNLARLTKEKGILSSQNAEIETERNQLNEALQTANEALSVDDEALSKVLKELAEHQASKAQLEQQLSRAKQEVKQAEAAFERLTDDDVAPVKDDAPHTEITTDLEAARAKLSEIEADALACEDKHRKLAEQEQSLRSNADKARTAYDRMSAEITALENVLGPPSATQTLLDQIEVDEGYEKALAAAFSDDLDATLDEASDCHWTLTESMDDPQLPRGSTPLIDHVQAPRQLERRLRQIGLADAELAQTKRWSLAPGQCLVSIDGDLWRWDGYTARASAPTAAASRLAERNRLESLRAELPDLEAKHDRAAAALQSIREQQTVTQEHERDLRRAWRDQQRTVETLKNALAQSEAERTAAIERQRAQTILREQTEERRQQAQQSYKSLFAQWENFGDTADLEATFERCQTAVSEQRAHVADLSGKLSGIDQQTAFRTDRLAAIAHETEQWTHRKAQSKTHTQSLAERETATKAELADLKDIPARIEGERSRIIDLIATAEDERKAAADTLAEAETALADASKALRQLDASLAEQREEKARCETRLENTREKRANLSHQIRESLDCAPEDCLTLAALEDGATPPDLETTERRMTRLRSDRERIGGVNLEADRELTDLSAQFNSLEDESADLETAIEELRTGISKLNREGRRRLLEAFEAVNAHFQKLFETLFGGGTAELQLIDAQDPLDAGLEIMARPPGKKPNTMSLLSGGEQALTALSLIFAVFLTNPSPICVLDEVDAPLDDTNVDRFCRLLEDMSSRTQTRFLVITHHPMTMSRMNRLFGVTMAERGVSQLVSVDLETAEGYREAS